MTESGFVRGQSDNLPKIDIFMMSDFFSNNLNFTSAEIKGIKASRSERESYGDNAIGYVQVKREKNICIVKAKITPEHNVRSKTYSVIMNCNETEEIIESVQCEDCTAHLGGCKHAIAFLAWLYRRSEDPPVTDVKCYWKRAKLSSVGSSLKFIKIKDINKPQTPETVHRKINLLEDVVKHCKIIKKFDTQLLKYFKDFSPVEMLSIHYLTHSVPDNQSTLNAIQFINYCSTAMDSQICEEVRQLTKGQASCPLWHELRYARVTASKAYDVVHCKTFDGTLVEQITGSVKLKDNIALERGRKLEEFVIKIVEKRVGEKIEKDGFILNKNYPVIGASPDGISRTYCVEVKCPMSEKAFKRYITKDNKISAKYMAQIQLQMFFSKKKTALFCLTHSDFENSKNVMILTVNFDLKYCEDVLEKCTSFWVKAIFPILNK